MPGRQVTKIKKKMVVYLNRWINAERARFYYELSGDDEMVKLNASEKYSSHRGVMIGVNTLNDRWRMNLCEDLKTHGPAFIMDKYGFVESEQDLLMRVLSLRKSSDYIKAVFSMMNCCYIPSKANYL